MNDALKVLVIVVGVLLLVALRIRSWIRKERVLREVGRDLHVPPPGHDDRD